MNRSDQQGNLFDHAARARDLAIAQVETAAGPDWCARALEAVRQTALERPEFICDDVWAHGRIELTKHARAMGPVFRQAAKIGWIKKTDRMRPSIRSRLSGKPIWTSLIYRAP